ESLVAAVAGFEVVDLTVTLAEHLPGAWPTHMPFQRKIFNWYAAGPAGQIQLLHGFRGPYQTAFLTLDEHCGTHIDAPAHFIPPPGSGLPAEGEMNFMTEEKL